MKKLSFTFLLGLFLSTANAQQPYSPQLLELNFLESSNPDHYFKFQDKFYFTADDGRYGRELYRLENGQPVLVSDFVTGEESTFNQNSLFLIADDYFYFTGINGKRLYKSDGTESGTTVVLSRTNLDHPAFKDLVEINSILYFGFDDGDHGFELWKTDGTAQGSVMVKDIRTGESDSYPEGMFNFKNKLYFTADDGVHGRELWTSDGTQSGTYMVKDIFNPSGGSINYSIEEDNNFLILEDYFLFYARDSYYDFELWRSDGTEAGTQRVKDINPGIDNGSPISDRTLFGATIGNIAIFAAYLPSTGVELWRTDGTEEGTTLIKDIYPGQFDGIMGKFAGGFFIEYGGKIYFGGKNNIEKIWVTDGTPAGTQQFINLKPNQSEVYQNYLISDGKLFFKDNQKVYRTDGQTTIEFLDMGADGLRNYLPFGEKMYFSKTYDDYRGIELWEGKLGNQDLKIFDLNLVRGAEPKSFGSLNEKTIFFGENTQSHTLMQTDGTPEGSYSIFQQLPFSYTYNYEPVLHKFGNKLYFIAETPGKGEELHVTDGTAEGTKMIKDIKPGGGDGIINEKFGYSNDILYFAADDGIHGRELWRTDGSEEGTYMVADLSTEGDDESSRINAFANWNNKFYFGGAINFLFSNSYESTNGIWKTDGTVQGTVLVHQTLNNGHYDDGPKGLFAIGDKLFYWLNEDHISSSQRSLYVADETFQNVLKLKEFSYYLYDPIEFNGKLMFYSKESSQPETLFLSDGTVEGTHSIFENVSNYKIKSLRKCGDLAYFFNNVSSNYGELWISDGTAEGTLPISTNKVSHSGDGVVCHNGKIVFFELGDIQFPKSIFYYNGTETIEIPVQFEMAPVNTYEGIKRIYSNGDILYIAITNKHNGEELYGGNFSLYLDTHEIDNQPILEDSKIILYPNPADFEINILSADGSRIQEVQMFDEAGRLTEFGIYNSEEIKMDTSKKKRGIYFLRITTGVKTYFKKLMIK